MITLPFLAATGERALKAAASALLALWLVGDVALDALAIDWRSALGIAAGAALSSVLMSIVSGVAPVGDAGSPSLVVTPGRHAAPEDPAL